MKSASLNKTAAFQLKGSLFTLTVLQLLNTNIELLVNQLEALIQKSPNFFKNAPIIIDLEKISGAHHIIDFQDIKATLVKYGLIPVGVRHVSETQKMLAIEAGLGVLSDPPKEDTSEKQSSSDNSTFKIIDQPVRSGQQVYAKGDLVILGPVSVGAELMADGNIHVYGPLRGRALAGIMGNLEARIFCQKLEADLISIAGFYKLRDDISIPENGHTGLQIYLKENKLVIDQM